MLLVVVPQLLPQQECQSQQSLAALYLLLSVLLLLPVQVAEVALAALPAAAAAAGMGCCGARYLLKPHAALGHCHHCLEYPAVLPSGV
jgi:hypothetical protein